MPKKPSEPRQIAAAHLSIAWADLMVDIAHSLPRWLRWYRIRIVKRSWEHRNRAFQILVDWETEKRAAEQFHERNDKNG